MRILNRIREETSSQERKYARYHADLSRLMLINNVEGFKDVLKECLQDGFPINFTARSLKSMSDTLLNTAVQDSRAANTFTRILLDAGADVNVVRENGCNTLMCACIAIPRSEDPLTDKTFREIFDKTDNINQTTDPAYTLYPYSAFTYLIKSYISCNVENLTNRYILPKINLLLNAGVDPQIPTLEDMYHPIFDREEKETKRKEIEKYVATYLERKLQLSSAKANTMCYDYEI